MVRLLNRTRPASPSPRPVPRQPPTSKLQAVTPREWSSTGAPHVLLTWKHLTTGLWIVLWFGFEGGAGEGSATKAATLPILCDQNYVHIGSTGRCSASLVSHEYRDKRYPSLGLAAAAVLQRNNLTKPAVRDPLRRKKGRSQEKEAPGEEKRNSTLRPGTGPEQGHLQYGKDFTAYHSQR